MGPLDARCAAQERFGRAVKLISVSAKTSIIPYGYSLAFDCTEA